MTITMDDIASKAGLSKQAVSFALRGKAGVGEQTRNRVVALAQEMGYLRNQAAQATRTGRCNSLALVMASSGYYSDLPSRLLIGLNAAADAHDQQLTLARMPDTQLTDEKVIPKLLRDRHSDGLLINYHYHIPPRMRELVATHRLPAIWINSKLEADCLYPDEKDAAYQATVRLLQRGRSKIAYVDYYHGEAELADKHYSATDRQSGYEHAMREAGRDPVVIRDNCSMVPRPQRISKSRAILEGKSRPDAVVTYGPRASEPVMIAAMMLSLSIPRDISVTTFNHSSASLYDATAETWIVPYQSLGEAAVNMLLKKIVNPKKTLPRVEIPYNPPIGR